MPHTDPQTHILRIISKSMLTTMVSGLIIYFAAFFVDRQPNLEARVMLLEAEDKNTKEQLRAVRIDLKEIKNLLLEIYRNEYRKK